jgi:hypothetical protein
VIPQELVYGHIFIAVSIFIAVCIFIVVFINISSHRSFFVRGVDVILVWRR